jgi:hypothetical protein
MIRNLVCWKMLFAGNRCISRVFISYSHAFQEKQTDSGCIPLLDVAISKGCIIAYYNLSG